MEQYPRPAGEGQDGVGERLDDTGAEDRPPRGTFRGHGKTGQAEAGLLIGDSLLFHRLAQYRDTFEYMSDGKETRDNPSPVMPFPDIGIRPVHS